jgi:hypothetical protein
VPICIRGQLSAPGVGQRRTCATGLRQRLLNPAEARLIYVASPVPVTLLDLEGAGWAAVVPCLAIP